MMESLAAGRSEILCAKGGDVLLYDEYARFATILAENEQSAEAMAKLIPEDVKLIVTSQDFVNRVLENYGYKAYCECEQYLYPQKVTLPVKHKDMRVLTEADAEYVCEHYVGANGADEERAYIYNRIHAKALYGVYVAGQLAGFAGIHEDGSSGLLHVEEAYRGQGLALALEAYVINRQLEQGRIPYGYVNLGNEASAKLQEKLGLYKASKTFYWLEKSTCN